MVPPVFYRGSAPGLTIVPPVHEGAANLLRTFASLPLMREVAKPKALTEGEKNFRYALSLSLLR